MKALLATTLVIALLTACGTTVSPEARKIQVHSQMSNLLDDCKKLGPVSGYANQFDNITGDPYQDAEYNLRQTAHDTYQADTVVVINTDVSGTVGNVYEVQGIALDCN